jgi:hypothetical protein
MLITKSPTLTIVKSKPIILTISKLMILRMIALTFGYLGKSASLKTKIPNNIIWFMTHIMPMFSTTKLVRFLSLNLV